MIDPLGSGYSPKADGLTRQPQTDWDERDWGIRAPWAA